MHIKKMKKEEKDNGHVSISVNNPKEKKKRNKKQSINNNYCK